MTRCSCCPAIHAGGLAEAALDGWDRRSRRSLCPECQAIIYAPALDRWVAGLGSRLVAAAREEGFPRTGRRSRRR